jgi:hypothetical protein
MNTNIFVQRDWLVERITLHRREMLGLVAMDLMTPAQCEEKMAIHAAILSTFDGVYEERTGPGTIHSDPPSAWNFSL